MTTYYDVRQTQKLFWMNINMTSTNDRKLYLLFFFFFFGRGYEVFGCMNLFVFSARNIGKIRWYDGEDDTFYFFMNVSKYKTENHTIYTEAIYTVRNIEIKF